MRVQNPSLECYNNLWLTKSSDFKHSILLLSHTHLWASTLQTVSMCLGLAASWGKRSQKYSQQEEGAKEVPEKERQIHRIHRADQWAGKNIASLVNGKWWLLPTLQLPDLRKGKVRPKQRASIHCGRGMWTMLFTCFKNGCPHFVVWKEARGKF